jgi:glycosyltransferase involved in cell wall biosynthesis
VRTPPGEATQPPHVIGRFVDSANGSTDPLDMRGPSGLAIAQPPAADERQRDKPPVAIFCFDAPHSFIGGHIEQMTRALARRGRLVHLFCRYPFTFESNRIKVHQVGSPDESDLIEQTRQFARRASNAFMEQLSASEPVAVIGYEWTTAPVLSLLKGLRNLPSVLSIHSLERQRSDLSSELSQQIVEIEQEGIETATILLTHDPATSEIARQSSPSCLEKMVQSRPIFPLANFEGILDPGAIKARYQVGPIDPLILFVGDLDERYGPDILLRAMPAILRHHPQARLVIVGDGQLFWPLKVYSRYLLLDYAIRIIGHLQGLPLHELVQAADVIVVPSREPTPWWPIQAGWAARKPIVATHEAARELTEHEKDSVLIYPSENSVVWGVERVLYDETLRKAIGAVGRAKLEERFGWNALAEHLEEILGKLQER